MIATASECVWIYVTTKDETQAKDIAKGLLEKRLVACANITAGMKSLYWWDGKIAEDQEAVLVLKTIRTKFSEVEAAIKKIHSYDEPCIVAMPIIEGSKGYLSWLKRETASPAR
jgi:periplasmic divalent cation tolerance protein